MPEQQPDDGSPRGAGDATGTVNILCTVQVGERLTLDGGTVWRDPDGLNNLDPAAFGYQWIRSDGGTDTDISGASWTEKLVTATTHPFDPIALFDALTAGTAYEFQVRAYNNDNNEHSGGPWSDSVCWSTDGQSTCPTASTNSAPTSDTSYSITGLTHGAAYTVQVRAVNTTGTGEPRVAAGDGPLVKNMGRSSVTGDSMSPANPKRAEAFRSGADRHGYALRSIGIRFNSIEAGSSPETELTATLNAVSGGNPGAVLCTLIDPETYTQNSVNSYQAPAADCPRLTPNTDYFVVLARANATSEIIVGSATNKNAEDSGGATGWSLGDDRHFFSSASNAWTSGSTPYRIEVRGDALLVPNNKPNCGAPCSVAPSTRTRPVGRTSDNRSRPPTPTATPSPTRWSRWGRQNSRPCSRSSRARDSCEPRTPAPRSTTSRTRHCFLRPHGR